MKITAGLSEGQVLQRLGTRGANISISGTTKENGAVVATVLQGGKALAGWKAVPVGQSAKGEFAAQLNGLPVGGPYALTLAVGAETVTIRNFYVGDVWLLAGQSNMEGVGNMNQSAPRHPLIRTFTMRREWRQAADPLHVLGESPDICHNSGLQYTEKRSAESRKRNPKGVGVGLFFAQDMLARTGIPQGLIATAHGGTSMAQWSPERKKLKGESLYYSMEQSVRATGQPLAGVLWYQGESDANATAAPVYVAAMKKLVAATRRDFRQPALPWVIVQLGRFINVGDSSWWNAIQEYQRQLPGIISNLETVPAIDLGLDDPIHIGSDGFAILGRRMASAAARLVLRDKKEMRPPQLKKIHKPMRNERGWYLDVEYDCVQGALSASGGIPRGFSLVDSAHVPQPRIYRVSLHGKTVRLHINNDSLNGLRLAYGHGFDPVCNIADARGFALPVFGPLAFSQVRALLPFVTEWRKSGLLPVAQPLDKLACRNLKGQPAKKYEANGFINESAVWKGKAGQEFFSSTLTLSEPMRLRFLIGYDGPFRMWVDGQPFYQDIHGINPCIADAYEKVAALRKGKHTITVAMDTNVGNAWGFFLRFERLDVTTQAKRENTFVRPEYSA